MTSPLLDMLARIRRRAFFAHAIRCIVAALAIVLAIIDALVATSQTSWRSAWPLAMLAFAVISALATAWRRTPTVRETARTVDARLGLKERVVTAVQYVDHPDAFSTLVVEDAVRWLERAPVADAFPLKVSRPAAVVSIAAILVAVALGVRTGTTNQRSSNLSVLTGSGLSGGEAAAPAAAHAGQTPQSAEHETGAGNRERERTPTPEIDVPREKPQAGTGTSSRRAGDMSAARGPGATSAGVSSVSTAAWAESQRAVSEQHVPAALRAYVRQYFLAIRTGDTPK